MTDVNSIVLVGNLVRDAEFKPIGQSCVVNFTIASNERIKNGDKWEDRPNYIDCSLFGKIAEFLSKYLIKGQKVAVQGSLHQDRWQDNNEKNHQRFVVRASEVELVGSSSQSKSNNTQNNSQNFNNSNDFTKNGFSEDIPF